MKYAIRILGVAILLLLAYLCFWPVPIDPAAWRPPQTPPFEGVYAANTLLADTVRLGEGDGVAPEDIAVDKEGRIYGGCEDGRILRWDAEGKNPVVFADTEGRPLGLHFDYTGNLIVADSYKGLLSISNSGTITVLATECDGRLFGFTDDLDITKDGMIYFSDASWKFGQTMYQEDLMEHRPNGRLLRYDPRTGQTHLVVDNLYFANGVAVSPKQDFVLVNETGKYRVMRYWLKGEKKGTVEKFISNLPGFPDGVSAGTDGVFWVALAFPRDASLDSMLAWPFLRKVLVRLPKSFLPKPKQYSFVLGLNEKGEIVHNFQDPAGRYAPITSAEENNSYLYFGSILEKGFGRFQLPGKTPEPIAGMRLGAPPRSSARGVQANPGSSL